MIRRLGTFIIDVLQIVVFAIAIFLFIYLLVLQPHKIKGDSMYPNFLNGEFLLTDKISYKFGEPKRGDVVVFASPPNESEEYIKRIIALPGERISIRNGSIYINGKLLEEPYLTNAFTQAGQYLDENKEIVVAENKYFVMGDNRNHSYDSRSWGPVEKSKITGRAWLVYWPPSKTGIIPHPEYAF